MCSSRAPSVGGEGRGLSAQCGRVQEGPGWASSVWGWGGGRVGWAREYKGAGGCLEEQEGLEQTSKSSHFHSTRHPR